MREKPVNSNVLDAVSRITPACAGKTCRAVFANQIFGDHPRVCGKNALYKRNSSLVLGSPPRVREKLDDIGLTVGSSRITPACAGKTIRVVRHDRHLEDHPRVCGKNHRKIPKLK